MTKELALGLNKLLEIGRRAIEDALIELRDERISAPFRNNGLVVKERSLRSSGSVPRPRFASG